MLQKIYIYYIIEIIISHGLNYVKNINVFLIIINANKLTYLKIMDLKQIIKISKTK
jgi:hypothetical protein